MYGWCIGVTASFYYVVTTEVPYMLFCLYFLYFVQRAPQRLRRRERGDLCWYGDELLVAAQTKKKQECTIHHIQPTVCRFCIDRLYGDATQNVCKLLLLPSTRMQYEYEKCTRYTSFALYGDNHWCFTEPTDGVNVWNNNHWSCTEPNCANKRVQIHWSCRESAEETYRYPLKLYNYHDLPACNIRVICTRSDLQ